MSTDDQQAIPASPLDASDFGDFIQPFQIEDLGLLGRLVRLEQTLDSAFQRQKYPVEVATLLSEAMALTACLSGIIKYDGFLPCNRKATDRLIY